MISDPASMEAGPELDALIAEKVMGWTRYPDNGPVAWVDDDGDVRTDKWEPSEEDSHALEALDHVDTYHWVEYDKRRGVFIGAVCTLEPWRVFKAEAPTRALAICRALLMWAEAKEEPSVHLGGGLVTPENVAKAREEQA